MIGLHGILAEKYEITANAHAWEGRIGDIIQMCTVEKAENAVKNASVRRAVG